MLYNSYRTPSGGSSSEIQFKFKFGNPSIYYCPHKHPELERVLRLRNGVESSHSVSKTQRDVRPNK
jgi:hypothetical protein